MRGSQAWERVSNGVPREIVDDTLRQELHDIHNVLGPIVDAINRAADAQEMAKADVVTALATAAATMTAAKSEAAVEHSRIHDRIDRSNKDREALKDKLFDPESGLLPKMTASLKDYVDSKTGKLTAVGMTVLGGVLVGAILLILQVHAGTVTKGG